MADALARRGILQAAERAGRPWRRDFIIGREEALYRKATAVARQRNAALLSVLDEEERTAFEKAIEQAHRLDGAPGMD